MLPDTQLLESALLVVRWQRGDREAFAPLVKLWERSLFYYLRRLAATEVDAWELLQETWLKTLKSLHTLRDPCALPSFLYTIARNAALSRLRIRGLKTKRIPKTSPIIAMTTSASLWRTPNRSITRSPSSRCRSARP